MLSLTVYEALWTADEVAFGANDPTNTTDETLTFACVGDVVAYLIDEDLTAPSSYPITGNEIRVWFSQTGTFLQSGEEENDRHERTAHRSEGISDTEWIEIVRAVSKY